MLRRICRWLHGIWCPAIQFRAATGMITMTGGTITVAACNCGLARAYDTTVCFQAGDLIRIVQ